MKATKEILEFPWMTEKSTAIRSATNQYVFKVKTTANKIEIKQAIEQIFKKKVVGVNTANYAGKKKRERRADFGKRPDWKKAIVTLKAGEKLDLV